MSTVYTELFRDTFQRSNEAPLNALHWLQNTDLIDGINQLQVLNNKCSQYDPTVNGNNGVEFINLPSLPRDGYCQATIGTFDTVHGGTIELFMHGTPDSSNSEGVEIYWSTGIGDVTVLLFNVNNGVFNQFLQLSGKTVHAGDIFRFECATVGSTCVLTLYQNGIFLATATDPLPPGSGSRTGLSIFDGSIAVGGPQSFGVTLFTAGSITSTDVFLGSVSETANDSLGTQYVGHFKVIGSVPSGAANPYLGKIKKVLVVPAGTNDPLLGEVVIVSGPPAGFKGTDNYLGHAEETS